MEIVSEIRRRLVVVTAENKHGKSKLDSFPKPEPVHVPEQMSDVVVLVSMTHKTRR